MINNVVLMGRMTQTPELKQTPNGAAVTSFTLAVERSYSRAGEERQADFIDCVAWRNTAEFIARYFRKGAMLAVVGSLQTRTYEDKHGLTRKVTELVVSSASFCGSKAATGTNGAPELPATPSFATGTDSDFEEITADDGFPF